MAKKLSAEVWERRVNDAGAGRYAFVRWAVEGEFGTHRKCVVRCKVDNFVWSASANDLVNGGHGCQQCSGNRRWTSEERIEQTNKLENIYFISWVDGYKNCYSKANVRCDIDGFEWSARVSDLVNGGYGCPQCAGKRRWTAKERIEQISKLEGIEFVSWVDGYKGAHSKANVKCDVDGFDWSATVDSLVNIRAGCPRCAKYGYQLDKTGYLYALRSECGKYVKVGISNKPSHRHRQLEIATPFKFNIVEQLDGDGTKIAELEKYFHNKHESDGFKSFDGATEWLVCTPELIEELRGLGDK